MDDVITGGNSIRHSINLINNEKEAEFAGVIVSLDRQEKGQGELSAIQEVENTYKVNVLSVIGMSDIIKYLEQTKSDQNLINGMFEYRNLYGC